MRGGDVGQTADEGPVGTSENTEGNGLEWSPTLHRKDENKCLWLGGTETAGVGKMNERTTHNSSVQMTVEDDQEL